MYTQIIFFFFLHILDFLFQKNFNQSKLSHDVIVLGSHTLDLFRDQIRCPNSIGAVEDMSKNPNLSNITLAKVLLILLS